MSGDTVYDVNGEKLVPNKGPRPGWEMPPAPACEEYDWRESDEGVQCGATKKPGGYCEDGWMLFFFCPKCDPLGERPVEDGDAFGIDWPFAMGEFATPADIEALGFQVFR